MTAVGGALKNAEGHGPLLQKGSLRNPRIANHEVGRSTRDYAFHRGHLDDRFAGAGDVHHRLADEP